MVGLCTILGRVRFDFQLELGVLSNDMNLAFNEAGRVNHIIKHILLNHALVGWMKGYRPIGFVYNIDRSCSKYR